MANHFGIPALHSYIVVTTTLKKLFRALILSFRTDNMYMRSKQARETHQSV